MPCKPAKARNLLKNKKAKVINRKPFTIQLLYGQQGINKILVLVLMLEANLWDYLQQQPKKNYMLPQLNLEMTYLKT